MIKNFIKDSLIVQNLASIFSNLIPTFILHNFEKYKVIRFTIENVFMDSVEGDYLEFGTFTGSSLNHAINSYKIIYKNQNTKIYSFDSFQGFPEENHKIFKSNDYLGNYSNAIKVASKYKNCKIVKGFFKDTLNDEVLKNEINKISIVFIDCDLAISSKDIFDFIKSRLSYGSFIIIDDFFNIDFAKNSIRNEFYKRFQKSDFEITRYFGLQGVVLRYLGQS
tara:strand:- start:84 stop:749 length:666 start_codon:yes stop_codon:yes gene_type:complete